MLRPTFAGPLVTRGRIAALGLVFGATTSLVTTAWMLTGIVGKLRESASGPWMLARASGFTSYLLMLSLVVMGLLLSHPAATRVRWPSRLARVRIHIALAVFTLAFTVLHVVVLATDPFAGVGWAGALLPMASEYRPVPVTLGVVAVWSGLLTGVTASLAGRFAVRIWWPIHKVAALAFVLVWAHGLLAGTDTPALAWFYVSTGMLVVLVGLSRYSEKTAADELDELVAGQHADLAGTGSRTS